MASRSRSLPRPGPQNLGVPVDDKSLAHPAHPSTQHQDDTVEAHYASLGRPHACYEGWVFVGYIDEHGEEREASYRCRRCGSDAGR
jgi:hypothetical protein